MSWNDFFAAAAKANKTETSSDKYSPSTLMMKGKDWQVIQNHKRNIWKLKVWLHQSFLYMQF